MTKFLHWISSLWRRGRTENVGTIQPAASNAAPAEASLFRPIGAVPGPASRPIISALDDSALSSIGELLLFETRHGHGWIGTERSNDVPPPFRARLLRFYEYQGNRRGGIAKVEQPGHPCDGLWVIFATRHVGIFDFADRIGHYNVALLDREPGDPVGNGTFWVIRGDMPGLRMAGFARIAAEQA